MQESAIAVLCRCRNWIWLVSLSVCLSECCFGQCEKARVLFYMSDTQLRGTLESHIAADQVKVGSVLAQFAMCRPWKGVLEWPVYSSDEPPASSVRAPGCLRIKVLAIMEDLQSGFWSFSASDPPDYFLIMNYADEHFRPGKVCRPMKRFTFIVSSCFSPTAP